MSYLNGFEFWRHFNCDTQYKTTFMAHYTKWQRYASIYAHTHTRLMALCPGLPGWAGTRKVQPGWILLKQETVSGSGISWAICKSASRSRQITMPAPYHSVFTGRMPFLPPSQQHQSTEGTPCKPVVEQKCPLTPHPTNIIFWWTLTPTASFMCHCQI